MAWYSKTIDWGIKGLLKVCFKYIFNNKHNINSNTLYMYQMIAKGIDDIINKEAVDRQVK